MYGSKDSIIISGKTFTTGALHQNPNGKLYFIHTINGGPTNNHIVYQATKDATREGCYGPTYSLPWSHIASMIQLDLL